MMINKTIISLSILLSGGCLFAADHNPLQQELARVNAEIEGRAIRQAALQGFGEGLQEGFQEVCDATYENLSTAEQVKKNLVRPLVVGFVTIAIVTPNMNHHIENDKIKTLVQAAFSGIAVPMATGFPQESCTTQEFLLRCAAYCGGLAIGLVPPSDYVRIPKEAVSNVVESVSSQCSIQ